MKDSTAPNVRLQSAEIKSHVQFLVFHLIHYLIQLGGRGNARDNQRNEWKGVLVSAPVRIAARAELIDS